MYWGNIRITCHKTWWKFRRKMMTLSWRNFVNTKLTKWSMVEITWSYGCLDVVHWEWEHSTFFSFFCIPTKNAGKYSCIETVHRKTSIRLRPRVILHDEKPVLFMTVKGIGDRESEGLFQNEGEWRHLTTKCNMCFRTRSWPRKEKDFAWCLVKSKWDL